MDGPVTEHEVPHGVVRGEEVVGFAPRVVQRFHPDARHRHRHWRQDHGGVHGGVRRRPNRAGRDRADPGDLSEMGGAFPDQERLRQAVGDFVEFDFAVPEQHPVPLFGVEVQLHQRAVICGVAVGAGVYDWHVVNVEDGVQTRQRSEGHV